MPSFQFGTFFAAVLWASTVLFAVDIGFGVHEIPTGKNSPISTVTPVAARVQVDAAYAAAHPVWFGYTLADSLTVASGFAVYVLAVLAVSSIVAIVVRMLNPFWGISAIAAVVSLGACGVWAMVSWDTPTSIGVRTHMLVALTIGLVVVLVTIAAKLSGFSPKAMIVIAGGVVLNGLAAMQIVARNGVLDSRHDTVACVAGLVWALIALALMVGLCQSKRPARSVFVGGFVGCILLAAYDRPWNRIRSDGNGSPNLLLLTADSLRADHISLFGGDSATPNLEALAKRGAHFQSAYSLAPWTVPSISGMMASKYPPGLPSDATQMEKRAFSAKYYELTDYWRGADGRQSIERLSEAGYKTIAVVANPVLRPHEWLFDAFDDVVFIDSSMFEWRGVFHCMPLLRQAAKRISPNAVEARPLDSTLRVEMIARHILVRQNDQPFFLWLHFMDPHSPFDPPAKFRSGPQEWAYYPSRSSDDLLSPERLFSREVQSLAIKLYDGEIAYLDSTIGSIVNALHARDLADSTVVCFSADHGEEFLDHGLLSHGHTLYNELMRVPLVFAGPGIVPQRISNDVSAIDVMPTLLALANLPPATGVHGESLLHVLQGNDFVSRPVFGLGTNTTWDAMDPLEMVIDGDLKLVRGTASKRVELYNLRLDPQEQTDIAATHEDDVRELTAVLHAWSLRKPTDITQVLPDEAGTRTEEQLEIMRSLGYID